MPETRDNLLPRHTIGVIAANVIALVAFACSPGGGEYPLLALGIAAFILVQACFPRAGCVGTSPSVRSISLRASTGCSLCS
jgi:hypothetical protein